MAFNSKCPSLFHLFIGDNWTFLMRLLSSTEVNTIEQQPGILSCCDLLCQMWEHLKPSPCLAGWNMSCSIYRLPCVTRERQSCKDDVLVDRQ